MESNQSEASSSPTAAVKKSSEPASFTISLELLQDYEFRVRFDREQFEELIMDEPAPLGLDKGPNASRILAAAVGNCLSASLLFCARKSRTDLRNLHTEVTVNYRRNETGRVRIGNMQVQIEPTFDEVDPARAQRCLEIFEDYCVVTQSIRKGIEVSVTVKSRP
jgi:uncharacterized OsmC-like protein